MRTNSPATRRRFPVAIAALAAATAIATAAAVATPRAAHADTLTIRYYPYCSMPNCALPVSENIQSKICTAVDEINLEYREHGLAFRYEIEPIDADVPAGGIEDFDPAFDRYSEINVTAYCKKKGDDATVEGSEDLMSHWRSNVAAANPGEISYMLRDGGFTWNCAKFPYDEKFGIVGGMFDGYVMAHEIGHTLSLLHPHTFEDPATDDPVDHDNVIDDEGLPVVTDTPADPGRFE